MEFVNPFKRKEHRDFIPVSVFPASKLTRTSLQIGRATPVYWIEAIKNNHWEVSVSQLTRFMTMDKPVMNDFEVNFGAFYVPYVALDELTGSKIYLRKHPADAADIAAISLDARYFFNPSSIDAQRHKCHKWSFNDYIGSLSRINGGLFDHLMYPVYDNVNIFTIDNNTLGTTVKPFRSAVIANNLYSISAYQTPISSLDALVNPRKLSLTVSITQPSTVFTVNQDAIVDASGIFGFMPFDIWCLLNPNFNFRSWKYIRTNAISIFGNGEYNTLMLSTSGIKGGLFISSPSASAMTSCTEEYVALTALLNDLDNADAAWSTYFGKFTREQVYDMYLNYVRRNMLWSAQISSTTWSMYPFLVYLRIYGDYFLNPLVSDKEEFFAGVTSLYNKIVTSSMSLETAASATMGSYYQGNNNYIFFFRYIRDGECLPVLWEKDYFTSAQIKETQGSPVTIASGDTIPELFYKRMWQKFKDLIARMGPDYKTNSDALYGGSIPDNTLLRSQVIGFKKFNVSIGAIAQTSQNSSVGTLGEFAGYAYSNDRLEDKFSWTAEENGMIMVLCWIRPLYTAISSAVPRALIKEDYLDYFLPQFAGVGYQDIPEVLLNPATATPNLKYAIQERYFEYYTMINECSGNFRDICRQYSVDRSIDTTIQLGETMSPEFLYITEADDINRIFTDTFNDPILASIYFDGTVTRQAPAIIRTDF